MTSSAARKLHRGDILSLAPPDPGRSACEILVVAVMTRSGFWLNNTFSDCPQIFVRFRADPQLATLTLEKN